MSSNFYEDCAELRDLVQSLEDQGYSFDEQEGLSLYEMIEQMSCNISTSMEKLSQEISKAIIPVMNSLGSVETIDEI